MNVAREYQKYCEEKGIVFFTNDDITPSDTSTLFTTAGMQKFKSWFKDPSIKTTLATNQTCLRVNDLEEIGDGTHFALFHMLGLFSFRDWTIEQAISFWYEFVHDRLGLEIDEIVAHPDFTLKQVVGTLLKHKWGKRATELARWDLSLEWSDGEIGGKCVEFFIKGIEIGNIVNPLGNCIDVGFGLERLQQLVEPSESKDVNLHLIDVVKTIAKAGYKPNKTGQGYVLRRILRKLQKEENATLRNILWKVPYYEEEKHRVRELQKKYDSLKDKFPNKSNEWWFETHGIELDKDR